MTGIPASTTLRLTPDDVSTLLGLVNGGLDEATEILGEPIMDNTDHEERAWFEQRAVTLGKLQARLRLAGRRLGGSS